MKTVLKKWYSRLYNRWYFHKYHSKPAAEVFNQIYQENVWNSVRSSSGPGSDRDQTAGLIDDLPRIVEELQIKTVLDLPCGDWHWMKQVDLQAVHYTGADIVPAIVQKNKELYEKESIRFEVIDLLTDELPAFDLVICRDCLVHFSFSDIHQSLANLRQSNSTYLLATTFPKKSNYNIVTGNWRPINLEAPPFGLPAPIQLINEGCSEGNGGYKDKSLGLWELKALKP